MNAQPKEVLMTETELTELIEWILSKVLLQVHGRAERQDLHVSGVPDQRPAGGSEAATPVAVGDGEGMKLFEFQTMMLGACYERCYVWAVNEEHARQLFQERHPNEYASVITLLFTNDDKPFCTNLSDSGWSK